MCVLLFFALSPPRTPLHYLSRRRDYKGNEPPQSKNDRRMSLNETAARLTGGGVQEWREGQGKQKKLPEEHHKIDKSREETAAE